MAGAKYESIFESFYKQNLGPLKKFVTWNWKLRDEEADEIVQESFLSIYKRYERQADEFLLLGEAGQKDYLYMTTANHLRRRYRKEKRMQLEDMQDDIYPDGIDQDALVQRLLLRYKIEKELPADSDNDGVRLHLLDGWTLQEVSEKLGIPIGTIAARVHRAKQRIIERFQKGAGVDSTH